MNERRVEQLGRDVAELLDLKTIKKGDQKGRYETTWGTKTALGLGYCVLNIVNKTGD